METDQAQLLKLITSFLDKYHIPYMITGALSVIYYGRPRASHDIDFVVQLLSKDVSQVLQALETLSPDFSYQAFSVEEAIKKNGMFQILYLPSFLKLDFWILKNDPFDQSIFKRKRRIKLLDQYMTISSPEDTILQKLRWYRGAKIEKHIVDAAFVYKIQKKNLDKKYLNKWSKELKITRYLGQLAKIDLEKYI